MAAPGWSTPSRLTQVGGVRGRLATLGGVAALARAALALVTVPLPSGTGGSALEHANSDPAAVRSKQASRARIA
jgi:hypothetical protein